MPAFAGISGRDWLGGATSAATSGASTDERKPHASTFAILWQCPPIMGRDLRRFPFDGGDEGGEAQLLMRPRHSHRIHNRSRRDYRWIGVLYASIALLVGAGFGPMPAAAHRAERSAASTGYRLVRVDPCQTDAEIDCDKTVSGKDVPHDVYVPSRPISQRHLAVLLHGTGARPAIYAPVAVSLATAGWYVISLRYVATTNTADACAIGSYRTDPECFRRFRSETAFGEGVPDPTGHAYDYSPGHIPKVDSVMSRLLRLVTYLNAHPSIAGNGWHQFLALHHGRCRSYNATYEACNLNWSRIAVGGHSQGAGIALYLSKFFKMARVVMLSGPEDAYPLPGRTVVSRWIAEGHFATPVARMYGFTHTADPYYRRQVAAWAALHLPGPFRTYAPDRSLTGSHRIVTSVAPACPQLGAALAAHSATSVVGCVDLPGYERVWAHLFGTSAGHL